MNSYVFSGILPNKISFYLRQMEDLGYSRKDVLSGTNLTPHRLYKSTISLVDIHSYIRVVSNIIKLSKTPEIAFLMGRKVGLHDLGVLGYAMLSSRNHRTSFAVWEKYSGLFFGNLFKLHPCKKNQRYAYEYEILADLRDDLLQFFIDEQVAMGGKLFVDGYEKSFKPKSLNITLSRPSYAKLYEGVTGPNVVHYNCERNVFIAEIDDAWFEKKLPGANFEVFNFCMRVLKNRSESIDSAIPLSRKVSLLVEKNLPDILAIEDVANEFHYAISTLSRRLFDEETSYKKIINQVRNEQAKNYIASTSMSAKEVAYALGYKNTSSFQRAFRSWNGISVSDYRATLLP